MSKVSTTIDSISIVETFEFFNGPDITTERSYFISTYIEGTAFILSACYLSCSAPSDKILQWTISPTISGTEYSFTMVSQYGGRYLSHDQGTSFILTGYTETLSFDYTNLSSTLTTAISNTDYLHLVHPKTTTKVIGFKSYSYFFEKRDKTSISVLENSVDSAVSSGNSWYQYGRMKQIDSSNYIILTSNENAYLLEIGSMTSTEQSLGLVVQDFERIRTETNMFIGPKYTSGVTVF